MYMTSYESWEIRVESDSKKEQLEKFFYNNKGKISYVVAIELANFLIGEGEYFCIKEDTHNVFHSIYGGVFSSNMDVVDKNINLLNL